METFRPLRSRKLFYLTAFSCMAILACAWLSFNLPVTACQGRSRAAVLCSLDKPVRQIFISYKRKQGYSGALAPFIQWHRRKPMVSFLFL
jgi:hypothetical protein